MIPPICFNVKELLGFSPGHNVNLSYRCIPAIRYAPHLIDQRAIGDIVAVRGTFLQDWGLDPSIPGS